MTATATRKVSERMGFFDRLRHLLSGGGTEPNEAVGDGADGLDETAFAESCARRDAYWAGIGTVESDVLAPMISPQFSGAPAWPTTRQAYRVIRRPGTLVIATDGLSDPFEAADHPGNGIGLELFLETADIDPAHAGAQGDVSGLSESWAFELLSHVAGTVASAGSVEDQLQKYGVLSLELPGVNRSRAIASQLPASFVTGENRVGVLLGMPVAAFPTRIDDMPLSPVSIVPVTLIAADELEAIRQGGAVARRALVEARMKSGQGHLSSIRPAA